MGHRPKEKAWKKSVFELLGGAVSFCLRILALPRGRARFFSVLLQLAMQTNVEL